MTMVNPWEEQFNLIQKVLLEKKCNKEDTIGVFNSANFLSSNFMNAYKEASIGPLVTTSEGILFDSKKKCIFVGLNFSEASVVLTKLQSIKWQGSIVGLGDWNIYSEELMKIANKLSKEIKIHVPTGWIPTSSINSKRFANDFKKRTGDVASPISAYMYDGIILASESLCNGRDIFKEILNHQVMLRTYKGRNGTGNLLSNMHLKTIQGMK